MFQSTKSFFVYTIKKNFKIKTQNLIVQFKFRKKIIASRLLNRITYSNSGPFFEFHYTQFKKIINYGKKSQ